MLIPAKLTMPVQIQLLFRVFWMFTKMTKYLLLILDIISYKILFLIMNKTKNIYKYNRKSITYFSWHYTHFQNIVCFMMCINCADMLYLESIAF